MLEVVEMTDAMPPSLWQHGQHKTCFSVRRVSEMLEVVEKADALHTEAALQRSIAAAGCAEADCPIEFDQARTLGFEAAWGFSAHVNTLFETSPQPAARRPTAPSSLTRRVPLLSLHRRTLDAPEGRRPRQLPHLPLGVYSLGCSSHSLACWIGGSQWSMQRFDASWFPAGVQGSFMYG